MIPAERKTAKYADFMSSEPGCRFKTVYRATVLKNGNIQLTENGTEDLWQKINAEKEHTDMAYVLKQMALGDYSAFNADVQYFDMTQLPKNRMEFMQLYMNIENDFNSLPLEIRQKFNNDFREWYMSAENADWAEKMQITKPEIIEKEVKEDAVE